MKTSIICVFGILFLVILGCNLPEQLSKKDSPGSRPSAESKDKETEELKEKLADLEKEIDRQKQDRRTEAARTPARLSRPPRGFGRVNSPRDGFLAFRSHPSSSRGVRLAKIAHGTTLKIYYCDSLTTLGRRRGHWCQVLYRGSVGWVFDAYLIR